MKTIRYFLLAVTCSLFVGCDTDDDGFYNEIYLNIDGLMTIETQPSYAVNDKLWVSSDFQRYVDDDQNVSTFDLDLYQTTGGASKFEFTYILEKQVAPGSWELVDMTGADLDIDEGEAIASYFIFGKCVYDPVDSAYEYRVGIPLVATGTYRLSFGYNTTNPSIVHLRSNSTNNNLFVNIDTTTNGLNDDGYYVFTVN